MTIIHVTAEGKAVVLSPSHPPRRAVPSSYIHPRLRHKPVTLVAPMRTLDAHVIATMKPQSGPEGLGGVV